MAAEIFLSAAVEVIIGELGKFAGKQIALLWGVDDDLQRLKRTISTIKSVLADAEKRQVQEQQIKTWLERLEDAVYEADDLADEISTEALQHQVMTGNIMAKQVRIFCSTSKQFAFRYKMGQKIRFLRRNLDEIADDRLKFHLQTGLPLDTQVVTVEREEHLFEQEEDVIGRDYEKTEIIKRLFDMNNEENLAVIPIVGVGGLGKTTLAGLVYNDEDVTKHFELVMWVNVPKVFDVKLVVKEILKPEVRDDKKMEELQQDLRKKIGGKKFLLVLDDVWDIDSREKWLKLENLLRDGANRSSIIVTTRDKKNAHIINGREDRTYNLEKLSDEMAWRLFTKLAFVHGQEPNDPNLVGIGKDIVKKCGGIPLVIRTIASMLYSINFEKWSSFRETKLSTIAEYDNDIIPILKLSYDVLPSHLKCCFGYCSLFPKNYVFDVEILINLWMAQGFIKLSNEDKGYENFENLLYRSFFEVVEIDADSSKVTKCEMHDCMHDLATSVMGEKCLILSSNDEKTERTRHVSLSFNFYLDTQQQVQALLVNTKRIRTIFLRRRCYHLSYEVLEKSILNCKFLRTLNLHDAGLGRISKSIGKLKHLRYLDLSRNKMKSLPNSITRLQNLETLNLSYCENLEEIPSGITKMFNLRHLHIESDSGTTLHGMPGGLDQLTNLQRLSSLPQGYLRNRWIPQNNESFVLHHISNWKTLNMMDISDLQHLPDALKSFTCLQKLSISRCSKLESLSPGLNHLTSLLNLSIEECPELETLSPALHHLNSLQQLKISRCSKLESLPPGLNHLTSLQKLSIVNCPKLESLPEWIGSLETLEIRKCPILLERCRDDIGDYWPLISNTKQLILSSVEEEEEAESLWGVEPSPTLKSIPVNSESFFYHLSKLKFLDIYRIEDLQHLPDGLKRLTSLEKLNILDCSKLQSLSPGLYHLTSLKQLEIGWCGELEMPNDDDSDAIMWQHLQSLSWLELDGLPKLVALPQGLQQLTTLQEIYISHCENLEGVLENISNLKSLKKLSFHNCPKLKSLPEGIDCLASLETLIIEYCPILLEGCREDKGDYWPKNSHIKYLELEPKEEEQVGGDWRLSNGGSDATIQWQRFESLSVLILRGFSKLVALPQGLQQLTSLQEIQIIKCGNLEFVLESVINLKKLSIVNCPKLESLPEWIGSLETLEIRKCPILLERCRDDIGDYWPLISHIKQLILSPVEYNGDRWETGSELQAHLTLSGESIPENSETFFYYLPKLKSLRLDGIEDLQHLPDGLKRLTSLEKLDIIECSKLQSLSPGLYHLTSLKELAIFDCEELEMPNDDGSDAITWQHLQSLSALRLFGLPKLVALPQGLQQLTTLQEITIKRCENLEAVLENISNLKSLKELEISNCPKLKSLPEGIDCLTSLETLRIRDCPILLERCREDKGDYWPKISHIKQLTLIKERRTTQNLSSSSKTRGLFNCVKIFKH